MEQELNPYAPPRSPDLGEVTAIAMSVRRHHLGAESSLKGLGVVCVAGGVLVLTTAAAKLALSEDPLAKMNLAAVADRLLVSVLTIACGLGLGCLQRWAWKGAIVLCVFYMALSMTGLGFPWLAGLVIYALVLRLLLTWEARRVMAADYCNVLRLAPRPDQPGAGMGLVPGGSAGMRRGVGGLAMKARGGC